MSSSCGWKIDSLDALHEDLEKQMIAFDDIVPFRKQWHIQLYSPRLINILLSTGPQIEAVTKRLGEMLSINDDRVPTILHEIERSRVMDNIRPRAIRQDIMFPKFGPNFGWWNEYNRIKHEMYKDELRISYMLVMEALAALAMLSFLAKCVARLNVVHLTPNKSIKKRADRSMIQGYVEACILRSPCDNPWQSLLFAGVFVN